MGRFEITLTANSAENEDMKKNEIQFDSPNYIIRVDNNSE